MGQYSRGPVYVDFEYRQYNRQSHKLTMPLNFAGGYEGVSALVPGVTFNLEKRGGGSVELNAAIQAIIIHLRQLMATGGAVESYTVWGMTSPEAEPKFLFSGGQDFAVVGPAAGLHVDVQMTMTFRTLLGGQYRFVFMDSPIEMDQVMPPSDLAINGTLQGFYLYMFSSDCVVVGRDGAFMAAGIHMVTKENDRLRKRRMGL